MPRKVQVYWINVPRDLSKCHSRRCEEEAVKDRLCKMHFIAWKMNDYQPPMPDYTGAGQPAEARTLKDELKAEKALMGDVIDFVARLPVDDTKTPEQLEELEAELLEKKAEVDAKKRESIAVYEAAIKKEVSWFAPVEAQLDKALELVAQKKETSRSTIRSAQVPSGGSAPRRKIVETSTRGFAKPIINKKRKVG